MLRLVSRFLRALFQFSKRAAGEATKFGCSGVELLGVVGAACLECGEPAAESGELIRRQLGNSFGDFFDFHRAQLTSSNLLAARQGTSISFLSFRIFPTVAKAVKRAAANVSGEGRRYGTGTGPFERHGRPRSGGG